MRFSTLANALFAASAALAQQHEGAEVKTNLPETNGAEISFFKIQNPTGGKASLSLVNYQSLASDGERLNNENVKRGIIVIHGLLRDPWNYENDMLNALKKATSKNSEISRDTVSVMAPYFPNGADRNRGYPWTDGLAPGKGSTSDALVWPGSKWSAGADNQYPRAHRHVSSFAVLDQLIQYYDNKTEFPNLNQIVLVGHSLGGQMLQRYAAVADEQKTSAKVVLWVGNPDSYVWLNSYRPLYRPDCPEYNDWREGLANYEDYGMSYGSELVKQGEQAVIHNFQKHNIAYARALQDQGDHSSSCGSNTTGQNRNERFFNFIDWFRPSCDDPKNGPCQTVDLINTSHNNGYMFNSAAGQARIFTDNWSGDGSMAYDYGYPRAQAGDDPYPNPSKTATPYKNVIPSNWIYAGGMKFQGCWSNDQGNSLSKQVYKDAKNSVDTCATACNDAGYKIAGMQNGDECWCGNSMQNFAAKVVPMSCQWSCPGGDKSQICGGVNRLSLYSAAKPATS
ncbi:hypothetical protein Q7P37_008117 [Cladosporium fusiforme]